MKRPDFKLFKSTAIRLAMQSILLYALLLSFALGLLYWASESHINEQIKTELTQELNQLQDLYSASGEAALIQAINQRSLLTGHIYYLHSSDGEKLAGNLLAWPDDVDNETTTSVEGAWIEEEIIPLEIHEDDAYWPLLTKRFTNGSELLIARQVEQETSLQEIAEYLIDAMGISMLFAILIAIILGRIIIAHINTISHTASEIMQGDLNQRIPISHRNDEFDQLSIQLNQMLDKIQQLIRGIREVTDNVAHDLRSPLTRMRNKLEVTLLETRSPEQYQQILRENIEDIEYLISTFNALLSIAQTEAGNHRTQYSEVNLKQLATDLMELYQPLTDSRQQQLEVINGEDSIIHGSRDLLAQSFGNLLENAIKYTPAGGHIKLKIRTEGDTVEVIVEDSGSGIPESEFSHVLEKFVRLESSRNTPGNGLGLSLVAAVANLHKAELVLENAHPGLRVIHRFKKSYKPQNVIADENPG